MIGGQADSITYAVKAALVSASLNSFALDYVARSAVGGSNLNFFILKQLPLPHPRTFGEQCSWELSISLAEWLVPRVLELTYTSLEMEPFARDLGFFGSPLVWEDFRRFNLRAELDAAFFHLYGIKRDDVAYIMETFPIVKRKDIAAYGSYRTKEAILEIYDEMRKSEQLGKPYQTRLDPPPANGWVPPPLPPLEDYMDPNLGEAAADGVVAERRATYAPVKPTKLAAPARPGPNLFEPPVPTLFDDVEEPEAPAPPQAVIGKATINGQPAEILKIIQLDATRTQYQVILESTGELKSYVSPPAKVEVFDAK